MLYRFLTTEPRLRLANLLHYARNHGDGATEGFWLLPPGLIDGVIGPVWRDIDLFPYPRPEGYDVLSISWADLKA